MSADDVEYPESPPQWREVRVCTLTTTMLLKVDVNGETVLFHKGGRWADERTGGE